MPRTTLGLLSACCLAAALLGTQAGPAAAPAAFRGASAPAAKSVQRSLPNLLFCRQPSKAFVLEAEAVRHGSAVEATITFIPSEHGCYCALNFTVHACVDDHDSLWCTTTDCSVACVFRH